MYENSLPGTGKGSATLSAKKYIKPQNVIS